MLLTRIQVAMKRTLKVAASKAPFSHLTKFTLHLISKIFIFDSMDRQGSTESIAENPPAAGVSLPGFKLGSGDQKRLVA